MWKIATTVVLTLAAAAGVGLGANPAAADSTLGLFDISRVARPVAASIPGTSPSTATPGAQLWVSRYNGPGNNTDQASAVAVSPAGDTVYVTGTSWGSTSGDDYATVAYNATTGAQLWLSRYNGLGNGQDEARSMAVSPAGDTVYVTGFSSGGSSGPDYATVAYNATTGGQQWVSTYNGPSNGTDVANSVAVSPSGAKVYVTGSSDGGISGADYATVAYTN